MRQDLNQLPPPFFFLLLWGVFCSIIKNALLRIIFKFSFLMVSAGAFFCVTETPLCPLLPHLKEDFEAQVCFSEGRDVRAGAEG